MSYTPTPPAPRHSPDLRAHRQRLLDVYGPILTEHQREACRLYLDDDWSYAELAEHFKVSRSGAHDLVRRGFAQLDVIENKLGHAAELRRRDEVEAELRGSLVPAIPPTPTRAGANP